MNNDVINKQNIEVFISYSSKNEEVANLIAEGLEDRGVKYWKAGQYTINSGEDFREKISSALKECKIFLIILSTESMNSPWVRLELTEALRYDKKIYSLKIDNNPIDEVFDFKLGCSQISDGTKNLNSVIENLSINIKKMRDQLVEKEKQNLFSKNKNIPFWNLAKANKIIFFIFLAIAILSTLLSLINNSHNDTFDNLQSILYFTFLCFPLYLIVNGIFYKVVKNYSSYKCAAANYILFEKDFKPLKNKKSLSKAIKYLNNSSDNGYYKATLKLSKLYKEGKFLKKDLDLSTELYEKSITQKAKYKEKIKQNIGVYLLLLFCFIGILIYYCMFSGFSIFQLLDLLFN